MKFEAAAQEIETAAPAPPAPPRKPRVPLPVITLLQCGVCLAVFIGLVSGGDFQSWESLAAWGYVSAERVWAGAYWSLATSAFVHLALWHLAFNVYWLWLFGGAVERALRPWPYLAFVLVAAVVSSTVQLAVSGTTGHGASGIVYALFGLMWASRNSVPELARALGRNARLFWMWLLVCILFTQLGTVNVGNGAHVGGLLFGLLAAHAFVLRTAHRKAAIGAAGLLVSVCVVSLFWSPWSSGWVGYKAYKAHADRDYAAAITGYRRSIALGGERVWALQNLALVYEATGATTEYEATLAELRLADAKAAAEIEAEVGQPGATAR